jgi:hypothetical protein
MSKDDLIREAMQILTGEPCGGIGADGATLKELNDVAVQGHNFADDAGYHTAQLAWRTLEKALEAK